MLQTVLAHMWFSVVKHHAGGSPEGEVPLRRRRALLMDGLSASLRLAPPEAFTPDGAQSSTAVTGGGGRKGGRSRKGAPDDGVLRRLLGLRKGRDLLARALALMCPPQVDTLYSPACFLLSAVSCSAVWPHCISASRQMGIPEFPRRVLHASVC
jgi:hypothetical protein